jgi:hypothetical protein
MKGLFVAAGAVLLALHAAAAPAADAGGKGSKVEYKVYSGYFESNKSGLKGDASYLAFTDRAAFKKAFGEAAVMGQKKSYLPRDAFDSLLVVAAVKRGDGVWDYKVEKVTADGGTLTVRYRASAKDGGGATFASPLVLSVPRGEYTAVEFVENGKKVGAAEVGK